jgi:hypothetical protein
MKAMVRYSRLLLLCVVAVLFAAQPSRSADSRTLLPIQEEVWALPLIHPAIAYVVHPVGAGPFPPIVMNHVVSPNQRERSFSSSSIHLMPYRSGRLS